MHHRAGVVLGAEVVDLVLPVFLEVALPSRQDVFRDDFDVFVPVSPALFVKEANGVHELVDDGPCVDTASIQAELLSPPSSTNATPATAGFRDEDVALLCVSRYEPDAGLFLVLIHGLGDDASLPVVE